MTVPLQGRRASTPDKPAITDTASPQVSELDGFDSLEDYLRRYEGFTQLGAPSDADEVSGFALLGPLEARRRFASQLGEAVQDVLPREAWRALLME